MSNSYRCAAAAGAAFVAAAAVLISGGCAAVRTAAVPAAEKAEAPATVKGVPTVVEAEASIPGKGDSSAMGNGGATATGEGGATATVKSDAPATGKGDATATVKSDAPVTGKDGATATNKGDPMGSDNSDAAATVKSDAPVTGKGDATATVKPDAPSSVGLHPLTGLPLEQWDSTSATTAAAASRQRPIMVMVNNHAAARPQSGLSRADVLMECLAEGEITRIVAFYEGGTKVPGMIGPVRSIRPYYIDLGRMFDAIEVHAGGSPDAYEQLGEERIDHLDEITNAGRFFWRESFRKLPHNLYTDMPHLRAGTAKLRLRTEPQRRPALAFAQAGKQEAQASEALPTAAGINGGKKASRLDVTFQIPSYVVSYLYDSHAGTYSRLVNGRPHTDLNDGSQLAAANVVVLGADHKVLDAEGRREVRLTGSGPAVVFRNGVAVQGTWRRGAAEDTFNLAAADGSRVALTPGRTHYLIVPNKPTFAGHVRY